MDTALVDVHLDHLFAAAYDATNKPGAADALLNELMEDNTGHNIPTSFGHEVQSHATAIDIYSMNNISAAEVNAEVDTALSDIFLHHLLAADYDPATPPGVATALLNELVENNGSGSSRYTADSLSQAPGVSGDVTVGDITQAALAKFVSEDTGETVVAGNSVADHSQGAAAGITEATIWAYEPRTLSAYESDITIVSTVSGSSVSVYSKDTWSFNISDTNLNLDDYESVAFLVKKSNAADDDEAILLVRTTTGLVRIDGAAPTAASNGTLTHNTSDFTVLVAIDETDIEKPDSYTWWLKGYDTTTDPDEGHTLASGEYIIHPPGIHAIT